MANSKRQVEAKDSDYHYVVNFKTYTLAPTKEMTGQFSAHVSMSTPLEYFTQFSDLRDALEKKLGVELVFIVSATPIKGSTRPPNSPFGVINAPEGAGTHQYRLYFLEFYRTHNVGTDFFDCACNVWLDHPIDYYSDVVALTEFCASLSKADWAVLVSWTPITNYERAVSSPRIAETVNLVSIPTMHP